MKLNMKSFFLFFLLIAPSIPCFAVPSAFYNKQQMIPAGHWIYDAIYCLSMESRQAPLADVAPLSVGELSMHFSAIDYESLSDSGKALYKKTQDFFEKRKYVADFSPVFFGFNINVNPLIQAKTNENIDWTFGTDYTGHLYGVNNEVIDKDGNVTSVSKNKYEEYASQSGFLSSQASLPFVSIPLYLGFTDNIMIETEPFVGNSFFGMTNDDCFVKNLPFSAGDFEFLWPRNAYGSAGKTFSNWGVNFHGAKQGLQIGRTMTGSIIYNNTFETDFYSQLSLYSPNLKYNMDVVEIDHNKFMYLHTAQFRPFFWKWLKCSVVEGTLINGPFELRYLNPLMIMHSFGSWTEYTDDDEEKYYGEAHVCAYMGINVEMVPVRNLRIYFYYAQNEIQPANELESENGKTMPDSLGGQIGFEMNFPGKEGGWWNTGIEGIYTTPYLYVKQGADWSLYRARSNMQSKGSVPLCSWIGTPFGPDALGFQAKVGYKKPLKWDLEIDYLFLAHGTNSFGMFGNTVTIDGVEYYAYYPSVRYKLGKENSGSSYSYTPSQAEDDARSYALTGTIQYTNQLTLKGNYNFNEHFSINSYLTYSFIFNNKNVGGDFQQGIEISVGGSWALF